MYGASTTEIDGTQAPKFAAPSVTTCCAPFATASIMSREPPSWPPGNDWITIRPPDFSFASAAMRSIICTDGCVPPTTSPHRIVTCWAPTAPAASVAAIASAIETRFIVVLLVMRAVRPRADGCCGARAPRARSCCGSRTRRGGNETVERGAELGAHVRVDRQQRRRDGNEAFVAVAMRHQRLHARRDRVAQQHLDECR